MIYCLRKRRAASVVSISLAVLLIFAIHRTSLTQFNHLGSIVYQQNTKPDKTRDSFGVSPSLIDETTNPGRVQQPLNLTAFTALPPTPWKKKRRISVELVGNARLGNLMFGHASMLGLATRHGLDPIVSYTNRHLVNSFDLGTETQELVKENWQMFEEKFASIYDDSLDRTINNSSRSSSAKNVLLFGYFQSWRYFDEIRERVKREFQFKSIYAEQAAKYVGTITEKHFPTSVQNVTLRQSILRIGIHVRRNDMLAFSSIHKGYTVPSADYVHRAMDYLEQRLGNSTDLRPLPLIYIVVSDDMAWCKSNLVSKKYSIEFSHAYNQATVDLAIMASCNHTIFTVGSFGWWAAYLAGGISVYYKDFPAPGSEIAAVFRAEDYFCPEWIGLS